MNVSSMSGALPAVQLGGTGSSDFRTRMEQGMAPVADLFGTTPSQLMSDVQASGGSLADYAASKGVSNDALIGAIKQGLQTNAPNGAQLSDTQLTNLANRIANHKAGDRPQGPVSGDRGSGAIGAASSATSGTSQIKQDLEQLIADLKGSESGSSTSSGTANGDELLQLLSSIDERL